MAPSLLDYLAHPDPAVRHRALLQAGGTRDPSEPLLRAIAARLHDDSTLIREAAAQTLASGMGLQGEPSRVIAALPAGLLLPVLRDRSLTGQFLVLGVLFLPLLRTGRG